jgi:thiosulfate/3-mercaptopyruvate sulfurtransferase
VRRPELCFSTFHNFCPTWKGSTFKRIAEKRILNQLHYLWRRVNAPGLRAFADLRRDTIHDARAPARFRGEVEPFDPVAGHIPGALNRPFNQNIGEDGLFKPAEVLRAELEALLGDRSAATVVHHCGSGVSAIPNILAMQVAGLGASTLFAGSWSEWCSDPARPVARG